MQTTTARALDLAAAGIYVAAYGACYVIGAAGAAAGRIARLLTLQQP